MTFSALANQSLGFVQATGQAKSRLGVGVHVASYISEEGALALEVALEILKELCLQNGGPFFLFQRSDEALFHFHVWGRAIFLAGGRAIAGAGGGPAMVAYRNPGQAG